MILYNFKPEFLNHTLIVSRDTALGLTETQDAFWSLAVRQGKNRSRQWVAQKVGAHLANTDKKSR